MMKRILFIREIKNISVQGGEGFGGIELPIIITAKELLNRKLLIPILATNNKKSVFAKRFQEVGEVFEYSDKNVLSAASDIMGKIKDDNIPLIESHAFRESIIARLVKKKIPCTKHLFRVQTHIDNSLVPQYQKFLYHVLDKITSRYVDKYLVSGNYLFQEITRRSWVSSKKVKIIADGCTPFGEPDKIAISENFPLDKKAAIVGSFIYRKGHHILIRALRLLKTKGIIVNVRIVGAIDHESEYVQSVKNEALKIGITDQIDFFGFTDNVAQAIKDFPVVVLPSYYEGLPNSIIEAMALKKLVVVSNAGGIPDLVTDGITGLLHPPDNPEEIADILEKIFSTPAGKWNEIRENAYLHWKKNLSVEVMMNKFIEEYKQMKIIE